MKILKKLRSWKKQSKDITIVILGFPSHRVSYKIIAIHGIFSKTVKLTSNSENLSEKILINIKSIRMTIENENDDNFIIWI